MKDVGKEALNFLQGVVMLSTRERERESARRQGNVLVQSCGQCNRRGGAGRVQGGLKPCMHTPWRVKKSKSPLCVR